MGLFDQGHRLGVFLLVDPLIRAIELRAGFNQRSKLSGVALLQFLRQRQRQPRIGNEPTVGALSASGELNDFVAGPLGRHEVIQLTTRTQGADSWLVTNARLALA